MTSLVAQMVKCLPTMQEIQVESLGQEDLVQKEVASHSSILACRIQWTEEPGGPHKLGSKESDTTEGLTHTNKHNLLYGPTLTFVDAYWKNHSLD